MAEIRGLVEAASVMPVFVVTGSEARPSTSAKVMWIGGTTKPFNMANDDIWLKQSTAGVSAPAFLTTVLNTMTQGVAFSQTLVLDGTTPMTFSIASGTLPAGISLHSSTGVFSGTPSAAGTYSFSVTATNAQGSATQAFSGQVTAAAVAPNITTTSLNAIVQGTPFTQTVNATGTGPLTWTVSGGLLPAGLSLNSSNGTISGTPTGTGAYSFTLSATNSAGTDTQGFTGEIGTTGTAPNITTTTLNALQVGISFTQTLARTGSTPITWGVSAGTIPAGLSINSSTGVISGTPSAAGAYSFTVSATNAFGSDTQAYSGTVAAATSADVYSIFGGTTWPLTSYTDGINGAWNAHQFYSFTGGTALPAGSKIIGARLYVPPGSAHVGQTWQAALYRNLSGSYLGSTNTLDTVTVFTTNGTAVTAGAPLAEGWNEVLYAVEHDVPVGAGNSWVVGIKIGDGTRYLYDSTLSVNEIQHPGGKNFYLAEVGTSPIARSLYLNTATSARWYGVDVLMRIPS